MKHSVALVALASVALASALAAVPAGAEAVHRTSIVHEGRTVAVSYEPRSDTRFKQTGIGPRANAGCLWSTRVSVERSVVDASGRPIAALSRTVGEEKAHSGMAVGYCRDMTPERTDAFGGDRETLRGFVTAAADHDAQGLRTELTSLGLLHLANAR